jgi:hypothetical protein
LDEASAERSCRAERWLAFLRNHREAIAGRDFFTVPTITLGVLYCFFIISQDLQHSSLRLFAQGRMEGRRAQE